MSSRAGHAFVLGAIGLCGLIPPVLFWLLVGRAPTLTAKEAASLLSSSDAVLVDVRTAEEYAAGHLDGAVSWPLSEVMAWSPDVELPEALRGRTMVLICRNGVRSARAALALAHRLDGRVFNLRGGIAEWTGAASSCPLACARLRLPGGGRAELPYRGSSLLEQWSVTLSAFAVKPLYMALSLALIIVLRRAHTVDLVLLRYGLVAFLAGETFCALNFLVFSEGSYLIEYLHVFGMVMAFGLTSLAIIEAIDQRVLLARDVSRRCALTGLCGACAKSNSAVPCTLRRLMRYLVGACVVIAMMPLAASIHTVSYNTTILGSPYNHNHPVAFQIFEIRYAPAVAILFFAACIVALCRPVSGLASRAGELAASGFAFIGFGMFRLIIYGVYRDNLAWYIVWEEVLELLYVVVVAVLLWLFRERLLAPSSDPA